MVSFVLHWLSLFAVFGLGFLLGGVVVGSAVANASPEVLFDMAQRHMIAQMADSMGDRAKLQRAYESEASTAIPTDERL